MPSKASDHKKVPKTRLQVSAEPVHIGKVIQTIIEELGMTKAEFGRRLGTSRQNVNSLLRKEHIDTQQLIRISLMLNRNLFAVYYHALGGADPAGQYGRTSLMRDALELGELQAKFISKLMTLANDEDLNQVS